MFLLLSERNFVWCAARFRPVTHRRLLDNVEDGDGQLRIGEGVRLRVDFGHFALMCVN